jgi:hypothetical protein
MADLRPGAARSAIAVAIAWAVEQGGCTMLIIRKVPFRSHHKPPVIEPAPPPPVTAPVPTLAQYFTADATTVITWDQTLAALGPWAAATFQTSIPPDILNMTGITLIAPNQVRVTTTPSGFETPDQHVNYNSALHTIKGVNGLNAATFFDFPVEIV